MFASVTEYKILCMPEYTNTFVILYILWNLHTGIQVHNVA